MKTILIGLGTGRCGTQSLAHMLDQHPQITMGHERGIKLPWEPNEGMFRTQIEMLLNRMEPQHTVVGDVASYWLPYVPLLGEFAVANHRRYQLRLIGIERPADEVVRSFCAKVGTANHWTSGQDDPKHPFSQCFPKYSLPREEAIARYCEEYRLGLAKIEQKNSKIIKRISTEKLNEPLTIHEIFAWLGLGFEYVKPLHLNSSRPPPTPAAKPIRGSHLPPRGRRLRRELPRRHKR